MGMHFGENKEERESFRRVFLINQKLREEKRRLQQCTKRNK